MLESLEYIVKAAEHLLQVIIICMQLEPAQDCAAVTCTFTEIVQQSLAPS